MYEGHSKSNESELISRQLYVAETSLIPQNEEESLTIPLLYFNIVSVFYSGHDPPFCEARYAPLVQLCRVSLRHFFLLQISLLRHRHNADPLGFLSSDQTDGRWKGPNPESLPHMVEFPTQRTRLSPLWLHSCEDRHYRVWISTLFISKCDLT